MLLRVLPVSVIVGGAAGFLICGGLVDFMRSDVQVVAVQIGDFPPLRCAGGFAACGGAIALGALLWARRPRSGATAQNVRTLYPSCHGVLGDLVVQSIVAKEQQE